MRRSRAQRPLGREVYGSWHVLWARPRFQHKHGKVLRLNPEVGTSYNSMLKDKACVFR